MERDLLRRKALFAASSVVLAATMGGCILTDVGADTAKADTAADTALADTSDTDTGGAPSCASIDMHDTAAYSECCDALAAWCNAEHGEGTEAASDCIWGPGFDGSTGCIPWGPPVPPRFRGAMA